MRDGIGESDIGCAIALAGRPRTRAADTCRRVLLLVAVTALSGCGLAETAATGAAGAAAEARAAESARAQMEATTQAVEQAQKAADEQRERALAEAGQ